MRRAPKAETVSLVLALLMLVLAVATWPVAPDRIPLHWDLSGKPDRYGGKLEGLFLLPAIALAVHFFLVRGSDEDDPRVWMRVAVVGVLFFVDLATILWVRGVRLDMTQVGLAVVAVALVVIAVRRRGR